MHVYSKRNNINLVKSNKMGIYLTVPMQVVKEQGNG